MMMVASLASVLPPRYVAAPRVHLGASVEIDVATFEKGQAPPAERTSNGDGGIAAAVWAPPRPTFRVATDLPDLSEYEVRVYDTQRQRRLVAAVEIVSPSNKDRPEHRGAFVAKCAALLQNHVSVSIVDLVTTRHFNLYRELLDLLGQADPSPGSEPSALYAVTCRLTRSDDSGVVESWTHTLTIDEPLPTLPLWLADDLSVPLDLEESYQETCRLLRIP
jgi:hypothetical protein